MGLPFLEVDEIFLEQNQNAYFAALSVVGESGGPLGAWYLRRALVEKGVQASEATCGRLLRMMEDAGHVVAQGRKGRAITASGERVLQDWNAKQARDKTRMALDQSLRIQNPDELLDVLVARRAIEAETAALAAERATPEEIESLNGIIQEQQDVLDTGSSATQQNTDFHLAVAHAGKNRVLIAALDLIYGHPDVMKALEYVRVWVGSAMVEDHRRIIQEIARQRPSAARNAMVKHMNNVIDDVGKYLRDRGEQEAQPDVSKREDPGRV